MTTVQFLLERLRAALADRYNIERLVGAGGMATVVLAEDLKHRRKVAVKVLRPELGTTLGWERFHREIQVAAQLRHPHILPLFDSGQFEGLLFYVMPYVEGESVRDRLRRVGRFPLPDAVRIANDVAEALSYAHEHGVTHRDIKPDNILLDADHAVVMDFGIAQALAESGRDKLTQTGIPLGTPAYMSPEQVMDSGSVDARSDVYSLGCVVFEMLSGSPPFESDSAQGSMVRRVVDPSPTLRGRADDIPPYVVRAVDRALARDPADRFDSASQFAAALTGAPAYRRPRPRRWRLAVLVAAVLAVVVGTRWWPRSPNEGGVGIPRSTRIAVLPFDSRGRTEEDEFFADGVSLDVTTRLSQISALTVVAHGFGRRYRMGEIPYQQLGADLGVDYLVTGSVRRVANDVRITVALVDPRRGEQVWGQDYDRELSLSNLFEIQSDISREVALSVETVVSPGDQRRLSSRPTANLDAWTAYHYGRFHWNRRQAQNLERAVEYFSNAIAADSGYVDAYVGLADAYVLFPKYRSTAVPAGDAYARAEAAARTALALDSSAGQAYATLGLVAEMAHHDWPAAAREFGQAVRLAPGHATGHQWYGEYLLTTGQVERALSELRAAVELQPLSPVARNALSVGLYVAGRYEEAAAEARRGLELDSNIVDANLIVAGAALARSSLEEFGSSLERARIPSPVVRAVEEAVARVGSVNRAVERIAQARSLPLFYRTLLYAAVGETDSVISLLTVAIDNGDPDLVSLFAPLPVMGDIYRDPRYDALRRRLQIEQAFPPAP